MLIGSHENFISVFKDNQLIWISKADAVPVALRVATLGGVRGLVVGMECVPFATYFYILTNL